MKILVLCTGNSARSQMAEGILKSLDNRLTVYSAGTMPAKKVNPFAIKCMQKLGIDINKQYPKHVDKYANEEFEFVITVCDNANENCPIFLGNHKNRVHFSFDDPATIQGGEVEKWRDFRLLEIKSQKDYPVFIIHKLYQNYHKTWMVFYEFRFGKEEPRFLGQISYIVDISGNGGRCITWILI